MSLDHILLGLLRDPASGYDLKKSFDQSVQNFWPAELSQIYPTLRRLEQRGWLESKTEPPTRGPARRVYRIADAGRAELRRWLSAGPQIGSERFAYLGQLFLMDELDDLDQTRAFMVSLREHLSGWHGHLAGFEQASLAAVDGDLNAMADDEFHRFASLRMGLRTLAAKVAWCDETIERIDARQAASEGDDR